MEKLEQEEEAKKRSKQKTHSPRKSEDYQRQKEEKLKALKEKKAIRMNGHSNDVANVNLSAINAAESPRASETASQTTIQVTSEASNTNAQDDKPAEGATRERKGSWSLKPTSTTRRGSITKQGPVVVGARSKSSDEHAPALEQAKEINNNEIPQHETNNNEQQVKVETIEAVRFSFVIILSTR